MYFMKKIYRHNYLLKKTIIQYMTIVEMWAMI